MKVLTFATHPIQYQVPIYRELSKHINLKVIYLLKQTKKGQADAGFGVEFEWDIPLLEGYEHEYLTNLSKNPSSSKYDGIVLDRNEISILFDEERPDAVIINGWFPQGMKQIIDYTYKNNITSFCRGDSTLMMPNNLIKKIAKEIYIRTILRKINYFLYVGYENKKYYQHFGVSEKRLFPAYHCVNTHFFKQQFSKIMPNRYASFINIGFVGKFIDIKNPFLLINALIQSKYKHLINLLLIGDGPLKEQMINLIEKHQIHYQYLGFLNQSEIVNKGYSLLDLLVLPSYSETWGLVVNEVMTGGIPCIVSNRVGCYSDLIVEGKTGYIFESNSVDSLTQRIDTFIEKKLNGHDFKPAVLHQIENYSLENTVKGYLDALIK